MLKDKLIALRKKSGYSQQELADLLSLTRQTISNWENGQSAPTFDKAIELAAIYHISLDDLADNRLEIIAQEKTKKDLHVLQALQGKTVILDCEDFDYMLNSYNEKAKVLEVTEEWIRVAYTRGKSNAFFKKETLINLRNFSRKFHSAPRFLSIISVTKIRQTARLDSRDNVFIYSESTLFRMSASGTMAFFASCTVLVCAPTSTSSVFGQ